MTIRNMTDGPWPNRTRWQSRGSNPNFQTVVVDPWIKTAAEFLCNISMDSESRRAPTGSEPHKQQEEKEPEEHHEEDVMDESTRECAADFLMHISQDLQTRRRETTDSPRLKPLDGIAEMRTTKYQEILQRNLHPDDFREQLKQSGCAVLHVTAEYKSPVTLSSCIRWEQQESDSSDDETERNSRSKYDEEEHDEEGRCTKLLSCLSSIKDRCCLEDEKEIKKPGKSYADVLMAPDLLGHFTNQDGELDPFHLDDPELKQSKDRTVLSFTNAQFVVSVLPYLREKDLKDQLNEQFLLEHELCESHPELNKTMSLSKIRAVKRKMFNVAQYHDPEIEYATVALAHLYFDMLVLKGSVTKANRYCIAGCCLVLAAKMNNECAETVQRDAPTVNVDEHEDWWEPVGGDDSDESQTVDRPNMRWIPKQRPLEIKALLGDIATKMLVPAKKVLAMEFHVFSQLNFGLHINPGLIDGVFERLLTEERRDKQDLSAQAYMSNNSYAQWKDELETFNKQID